MKLRAVYSARADPAAADALGLADETDVPDRIFALGGSGLAVAQRLLAERESADELFVDAAAAFLLEEQAGAAPSRPAAPRWLQRVLAVCDDPSGLLDVPHAARGLELSGRVVVMAAALESELDDGELQNANVWLLGGDVPRADADEARIVLCAGDFARGGGVLDVEILRGVITATVRKGGDELLRFEHQLRASTKMSVQG